MLSSPTSEGESVLKKTNGTILFTIGYEDSSLNGLVRKLQEHGVTRLVDVRERPYSRRPGFSAMALFEGLRKAGIAYEHIARLGNPPEIRELFHNGNIKTGRHRYRRLLTDHRKAEVKYLTALSQLQPTAILCRERDHVACHRDVIAELVVDSVSATMSVRHL